MIRWFRDCLRRPKRASFVMAIRSRSERRKKDEKYINSRNLVAPDSIHHFSSLNVCWSETRADLSCSASRSESESFNLKEIVAILMLIGRIFGSFPFHGSAHSVDCCDLTLLVMFWESKFTASSPSSSLWEEWILQTVTVPWMIWHLSLLKKSAKHWNSSYSSVYFKWNIQTTLREKPASNSRRSFHVPWHSTDYASCSKMEFIGEKKNDKSNLNREKISTSTSTQSSFCQPVISFDRLRLKHHSPLTLPTDRRASIFSSSSAFSNLEAPWHLSTREVGCGLDLLNCPQLLL